MTTIELLDPGAGEDALVDVLMEIVNPAYDAGEDGLWHPGALRVIADDVHALIARGELAVARRDGRVVGCVRVRQLDPATGELGLLAAARDTLGLGIGRDLIGFAEELSRARGATAMQLRLLVPRGFEHPFKVRLDGWYTRLGYRVVRRLDFAAELPAPAGELATACDLLVYEKPLA
jgi:GNAT superfamily N-acetyltransferase